MYLNSSYHQKRATIFIKYKKCIVVIGNGQEKAIFVNNFTLILKLQ